MLGINQNHIHRQVFTKRIQCREIKGDGYVRIDLRKDGETTGLLVTDLTACAINCITTTGYAGFS